MLKKSKEYKLNVAPRSIIAGDFKIKYEIQDSFNINKLVFIVSNEKLIILSNTEKVSDWKKEPVKKK